MQNPGTPVKPGQRINPLFVSIAAAFIISCGVFAALFANQGDAVIFLVIAAMAGAYMAINIGANDVVNNVAPAYGSGALTLLGVIIIAALFESAGALIAGGNVVSTISKGIIAPDQFTQPGIFIMAMIAALLAGALWLNLATWLGAPVSTTHSIVGGVLGAGIAAAGTGIVNWPVMAKIAASWVISPVLGGLIAAMFLALLELRVYAQKDRVGAARRWVPVLLALMAGIFTTYLAMKGLKKIWHVSLLGAAELGVAAFVLAIFALRPVIARASKNLENKRRSINTLFNIPLIFATALLSFAHGANDVANAIGPLSAVVNALHSGNVGVKVAIPFWVMVIGALGIVIGLSMFGATLIKKIGKKLTVLNQARAYCITLSAAITVIAASALGLPVSSTHIAIGAIFGIGFFREFVNNSKLNPDQGLPRLYNRIKYIFTGRFANPASKMILRKPRKLVRRKELLTIAAAWVITVPSAALISAILYYAFSAIAGV